jgi:hypothetical protein
MQRVMEAMACLRATRTSSRPSTCTLSSFSNNLVSLYKNQRENQNGVVNTNEFEMSTLTSINNFTGKSAKQRTNVGFNQNSLFLH